ncbi:hypothetical protein [Tenacibaculum sp. M341]|uniref:hypothetical protein n=1 Tax=Tenacibaculum sp. M341 TaxID=2530339 RepID=UPI001047C1CF|nr:hypothetical protein [Tenacibaculum sp. M341]TCI95087.1 hypothetical protein EYW44_01825 [Tenacibaculum sp. M341]
MTRKPSMKVNQKRSVPAIFKNGELAVFYNLAYNRTSNFINTIQKKDNAHQFKEIRHLFFPLHYGTETQKEKIDFEDLKKPIHGLTNRTYSELKVFLWNAVKGKNIRFVTPEEITEINHILLLLLRLRDYHSHYWHEESAIYPTKEARIVLDRTFNIALRSYQPQINFAIDVTPLKNCWNVKDERKLSNMGINFFLSFFLTRGQMELFMKSRQYLNRGGYKNPPTNNSKYLFDDYGKQRKNTDGTLRSADDVLDLEKSRFIASFYAQRDASESAAYWLGKLTLNNNDIIQYHLLQTTNYLESLPSYLYNELSDTKKLTNVQRIAKRPTELLAASIAHSIQNEPNLAWRIRSDEYVQKKVAHNEKQEDELQKIPEAYYTTQPTYVTKLGTTHVTASRLNHTTGNSTPTEIQTTNELYTTNQDQIMIRLQVTSNTYMHFTIGHQNLKHWGALACSNRLNDSVTALKAFAKDFTNWLQCLTKPTHKKAFFINNSYLQHFNGEKNTDGTYKHQSLLPKILLQLQQPTLSNKKAMEVLRKRIQQKIERITNPANKNHFANLVTTYNKGENCTGYFEKKEQEKLLKQINTIQNRILAKKANEKDHLKKQELQRLLKRKNNQTIRHKKMQLMYASIQWLLGKKGKFTSATAKKQFAKYCYLLDVQAWKEENKYLITDWLNVACKAKQNLKNHENNLFEPYQKEVQQALLEAISFDNCFKQLTKLVLQKYKDELKKLPTYDKYENLIGLARQLDISNPSNSINKSDEYFHNEHANRKAEILAPFYTYNKNTNTYNAYLKLPHDFFLIAPETRGALKHRFKKLEEFTTTSSKIKSKWQSLESNTKYQTYFADFKETITQLKVAKSNSLTSSNSTTLQTIEKLKDQRKKVQQWYDDLYTDTILTLLQEQLLKKSNQSSLQLPKEKLLTLSHKKGEVSIKHDGITISFPVKRLKSHDFYTMNRIKSIVGRLKKEHPTKDTYTYQEIKTAMQQHWKESIEFVSRLLTFEKNYKKEFTNKNDISLANMGYVSFEDFKNELGNNFSTLKEIRNKALHADILPPNKSYKELIKTIPRIKKPYKKHSKSFYKR